jgi:DNA-binding Lrp family transcriptional regulator
MLSHLSALPQTTWLFSLYGYYHFGWAIRASSISMLEQLLAELDKTFGNLIQKRSIGIIARYVHFVPWLAHSGKGPRKGFEFTLSDFPTRIDDVDRTLITLIRKAPSASIVEWSRMLGLPSSTVSYRFDKLLENGVLIAFFYNYETRVIGTECFLILVALYGFGGTAHDQIIEFARNHPRATWAARIMGEWHVEIEVALDDPHELHRIIEQIHEVGQGQVREVITHAWGQDL